MEIEAKIELDDIHEMRDLERKLASMVKKDADANPKIQPILHDIVERNLIYTRPNATDSNDGFLRIRYETYILPPCGNGFAHYSYHDRTILTHKDRNTGEGMNCREEDEAEIHIPNGQAFENVIKKLGLEFFTCYAKQRQVAGFSNSVFVSLDLVAAAEKRFSYLPRPDKNGTEKLESYSWRKFIEIEGPAEKDVLEMMKKLGLEGKPIIKESYEEIFK